MDISETLAPASDQLDAIELVAGPRTFTIESVAAGTPDQPVQIKLADFPRVWRPSKGMRRVLAAGWGVQASTWTGRKVTLFYDPDVTFGKDRTGGTRISHMTDLPGNKPLNVPLLITRGKSAMFTVQPLKEAQVPDYLADAQAAQDIAAWRQVWQRAQTAGHLTDALKAQLTPLGEALKPAPAPAPVEEPPTDGDWPTPAQIPGTEASA